MNNIKIEINKDQPLGEIVRELESLGWFKSEGAAFINRIGSFVVATDTNRITWCSVRMIDILWPEFRTTTLAELKEMK